MSMEDLEVIGHAGRHGVEPDVIKIVEAGEVGSLEAEGNPVRDEEVNTEADLPAEVGLVVRTRGGGPRD